MPDDFRDLEDLDRALFDDADVPTLSHDAGVGHAGPRFTRAKRVLVALAVITLAAVAVTAALSFESDSSGAPTGGVEVPAVAKATSTSVALRSPESLPVASMPPQSTTVPERTTTTRQSTVTTEHVEEPPATEPDTEPPPTEPSTTSPPSTTAPATTTTTLP